MCALKENEVIGRKRVPVPGQEGLLATSGGREAANLGLVGKRRRDYTDKWTTQRLGLKVGSHGGPQAGPCP